MKWKSEMNNFVISIDFDQRDNILHNTSFFLLWDIACKDMTKDSSISIWSSII